MGLLELRHRLAGTHLFGENALRGESLHLSHLRETFHSLAIPRDARHGRPLVVLAFTNRSGSTHLGRLLASAPDLYGFREDLNHGIAATRARAEGLNDLASYLDHVVGLNAVPSAGFGLKASAEQLRLIRMTGIDRAFERTTVIRIRRRDRVAQAVSLWIAWQTRQWTSRQTPRATRLSYDHQALRKCLQGVQEAESALDLVLGLLPYPVLPVEYEALSDDAASVVAGLRRSLGLPPVQLTVDSGIKRQVTDEKSEIVRRFRAELARSWNMVGD